MASFLNTMSGRRQQNHSIQKSARSLRDDPFFAASNMFSLSPEAAFLPQQLDVGQEREAQIVQHDYTDHSLEVDDGKKLSIPRGGVSVPFPSKLHELLDRIEQDGHADVVSWQPHGRCFVVHKQIEFTEHVMPKYFKQSKFASFQRQLNLYGFRRLTRKGEDRGGYYHELFLKGKLFLAHRIPRMRVKGTGVRARSDPENEPNFYKMSFCLANETSSISAMSDHSPLDIMTTAKSKVLSFSEHFDTKSISDEDLRLNFADNIFHTIDDSELQATNMRLCSPSGIGNDDDLLGSHPITSELLQRINITDNAIDDISSSIDNDDEFASLLQRLIDSA